jgi:Mycoplasma protein of unknown function, DUF285
MAKLLGGTQIYGNATVNSYLVVGGNADLSGGNVFLGAGNTSISSITLSPANATSGNGYTTNPTVTISAPTTLYGGTATANANIGVVSVAISSGGSSYYVGNVLTMIGTANAVSNATFTVTSVASVPGAITGIAVTTAGVYFSSNTTNPVTTTVAGSGGGTGATLTCFYGVNPPVMTYIGTGYTETPTVTITGGGSSGAANVANAYAYVGTGVTTVRGLAAGGIDSSSIIFSAPNGPAAAIADRGQLTSNFVTFTGGPQGGGPIIAAAGVDPNITLSLRGRGTGGINLSTQGSAFTQLFVSHTANPVNYVNVTGAATGNSPTISAQGSDASTGLILQAKGGSIIFVTRVGGNRAFNIADTSSSVNYLQVTGAIANSPPALSSQGTDTDINLVLTPKGTGNVQTANPVLISNANVAVSTTSGALIVAGGAGIAGNLWVGNVITTNGIFWANGTAYSSGSGTYGNTQVSAYLPIDPTIYSIQSNLGSYQNTTNANIGTLYLGNIGIQANLGAFQTYANATFATAGGPSTGTLSANLGAYQIYANANVGTLYLGNISTQANIGAYYVFANANLATQTTNINSINANLGSYQTTTNANVGSIFNNLNTLTANVGSYETTTNANIGTLYLGNATTQANIGAFYAYANTAISSLYTNANANTAAYLGSATAVYIKNVSTANAFVTGGYADNFPVGANTKAAGAFTTLIATGITTLTGGNDATSTGSGQLQVTGGAGITGNLWVGGNLYVANLFATTTNTLVVNDPLVYFQNPSPQPYNFDLGFYSDFVGGPVNAYGHTGLVRQQSGNAWVFFSNIKSEPTSTNINWNDPGLIYDAIVAGNIVAANTTSSTSTATGALIVKGGAGVAGALWIATTGDVSANIGTIFNNFNTLNANVGLYEISTNANIGTLVLDNATTQANIGAFYAYANTSINTTSANIGTIFTSLNTLNANVGTYETTTNANIGTQFNNINSINANVGSYQNTTNANIGTLFLGNASTNANLGSYQNTTNANIGNQFNSINAVNANIGAYYSFANAAISSLYTNANSNTAAYLSAGVSGNIKTSSNVFATGVFIGSGTNISGLFWSANNQPVSTGGGGGVTQIIAGTNVTISPAGGTGAVTINATAGGSSFTGGYVANQSTFGANLVANSGATSTSNVTGALVVTGGIGTSGNVVTTANVIYANVQGGTGARMTFNPVFNSIDTIFG